MGYSNKVERAESRRLLRRISEDVTIISADLKRAESILYFAMAEEAAADSTGNYTQAERHYTESFYLLTELVWLVRKAPAAYEDLTNTIQDIIQIAQTGVLEAQLKTIAAMHSKSIDDKL